MSDTEESPAETPTVKNSLSRRIVKVLKWTGIGLAGLVAILLIINAVAVWITDSQVERRLAAIRAAGDPISILEYRPDEIPPEENAATYLRRAKSDAEALTKELEPISGDIHERGGGLTDAEVKAMESAFAAYPKVMPLIEQAAECSSCSGDIPQDATSSEEITNALIEGVQEKRLFARLLYTYRFNLLLAKEEYDAAVRDCTTLLKLCRHLESDPTLVSFLVSNACRGAAIQAANDAIQSGDVSKDVLADLDEELAKIDIRCLFTNALKSERAFSIDRCQEFRDQMWPSRAFFNRQTLGVLDVYDWILARAATLGQTGVTASGPADEEPPSVGVLGRLLIPALESAEDAALRVETMKRALRILAALKSRDEPEKPPKPDFSDLGLPKSETTDPFSGKPFIVKKADNGWLIYSVGSNGKDEGGKSLNTDNPDLHDLGLGPTTSAR